MPNETINVVLTPATIAKLDLGPDDIVVVQGSAVMDAQRAQQVGETVKEAVGDHRVLVLMPNLSLEIIAKRVV